VLTMTGFPLGAVLSDGVRSFTASASQRVLNLAGWDLAALRLSPPHDFNGTLELQLQATAIESATGERATATQLLRVEVLAVADAPTLTLAPRDTSLSR